MKKIEQYLEIIRHIIIENSMTEYEFGSFNEMIQKQLKIDKNGIEVILASIDVIGDTQEAIDNFCLYGLKEDVGEKYVRLYGILNAVYLHSQAVISLARFFKVNNINKIKQNLNSNAILNIRHKLGAHSVGFKEDGNTLACYTPVRMLMNANNLTFYNMNPESTENETINLYKEIEQYLRSAQDIVEITVRKATSAIYKNKSNKMKSINDKIEDIRSISKEFKCQPTSV